MSKNTETHLEILAEENEKLEKLTALLNQTVLRYEEAIKNALKAEISTKRLEEVIEIWNEMFNNQKKQIEFLKENQLKENDTHRKVTYVLLGIIVIILIFKII